MFTVSSILTVKDTDCYAVTVTTGWLLCQWYAGKSVAIPQSVIFSDNQCHESESGTLLLQNTPVSRNQPDRQLTEAID